MTATPKVLSKDVKSVQANEAKKRELNDKIRKFSTLVGLVGLAVYGVLVVDGYATSTNILGVTQQVSQIGIVK